MTTTPTAEGEKDDGVSVSQSGSALHGAPSGSEPSAAFQARVVPWMRECFGDVIASDKVERKDRFLEESLERVQARDDGEAAPYSAARAHALVDYVFGRPPGEPYQETGGVMVTLAALSLATNIDMQAAGETELARIWTKVPQIRAKQAAKPTGSALPIAPPTQPLPAAKSESHNHSEGGRDVG